MAQQYYFGFIMIMLGVFPTQSFLARGGTSYWIETKERKSLFNVIYCNFGTLGELLGTYYGVICYDMSGKDMRRMGFIFGTVYLITWLFYVALF